MNYKLLERLLCRDCIKKNALFGILYELAECQITISQNAMELQYKNGFLVCNDFKREVVR